MRLQQSAAALGSEPNRISTVRQSLFIAPHDQLQSQLGGVAIAKFEHLADLVPCVDMEKGDWARAWVEGLLSEPKHDGGVFADGIEHHRVLKLGDYLAEDVNALSLEKLNVVEPVGGKDWLAHW